MEYRTDEEHLQVDVDAQPLVQAAAALQPVLRKYHDEIEREQRMPPALVEQLRESGFYKMVIPRSLGGLQVDPLTYLRVIELLAEGAGSVGWNLGNGGVGQLVTLGLPDDGVDEIYGKRADTVIAGTAVPGGGKAVAVAGGYRVSGHWQFGSGCQEASWMLGSFQVIDDDGQPRRHPDGSSLYWRGVFARSEAEIVPEAGTCRVCAEPAASTGRSRTSFCRRGGRCRKLVSRSKTSGRAGRGLPMPCRSNAGSGRITAP